MSLKTLREALCREQVATDWPDDVRAAVTDLTHLIDQHQPLGPDGMHGDQHTPTCGCPMTPTGAVDLVAALRASVEDAKRRREAAGR